jgi:hypothetical protein
MIKPIPKRPPATVPTLSQSTPRPSQKSVGFDVGIPRPPKDTPSSAAIQSPKKAHLLESLGATSAGASVGNLARREKPTPRRDFKKNKSNFSEIARGRQRKRQKSVLDTAIGHRRIISPFISSTFRDMDEERSYLMSRVFTILKDECESRHLLFTPRDLRWGMTWKESQVRRCTPSNTPLNNSSHTLLSHTNTLLSCTPLLRPSQYRMVW